MQQNRKDVSQYLVTAPQELNGLTSLTPRAIYIGVAAGIIQVHARWSPQ